MLFIICDGQPNDDGYTGTAAEADLRGIKLGIAGRVCRSLLPLSAMIEPILSASMALGIWTSPISTSSPVMLTQLIARNLPK